MTSCGNLQNGGGSKDIVPPGYKFSSKKSSNGSKKMVPPGYKFSSKKKSFLRLKNKPLKKKTVKRSKRSMRGRRPTRSGNRTAMMRRGKRKPSSKGSMSKPKKTVKKAKKKGKKKMNAYMIALQKARKANAPSFTYNGKTYYQKKTKTGMVIYGGKK